MLIKPMQIAGQVVVYALIVAFIGYFSNSPSYRHLPADQAVIKLSLRHSGKLIGECVALSAEEMARLPANMRVVKVCPRERSPLLLELEVNGERLYSQQLDARGLHNDGMAVAYERLSIPAGEVKLKVRMKDHIEQSEFIYSAEQQLNLAPAQVLVIDFNSASGEFTFL